MTALCSEWDVNLYLHIANTRVIVETICYNPPFHPLAMTRHSKIAPALLAPPLPIIPEPSQWDALSEAMVSRGWQPPHLPGSAESRDAALPFGQPPPPPYPPPCEEPQQQPPPPTYPPPVDVKLLVRHLGDQKLVISDGNLSYSMR